jgi:ATP-dependent exoDNAse (exonuclease V) beta subunit
MIDQPARDAALNVDRHLLLQAPAGSGKTTVLAQRFLAALAQVDEPEEVLAITFTRKAAAEMRERVLLALEGTPLSASVEQPRWAALRAAVLAQAAHREWQLEELPARLRIQTIDSLCHEIARAMPLLGRMQQQLQVVDNADSALQEAALHALRLADAEPEYQVDADRLLRRLDNNWDRACELLAQLLASRNRWLPVLLATPAEALGARVAASLTRIVGEAVDDAEAALGSALLAEAVVLARASAANSAQAGDAPSSGLALWQGITQMALKVDDEWRDKVTATQGFPASDRALQGRWRVWQDELRSITGMGARLQSFRTLPPPIVDAEECAALASLSRLMLLCAAQLKLVFRQRGQVDHSEVAAVARQALSSMGTPTELALRQTLRLRHILVDEFQDVSPDQLDLIYELTRGWDGDIARSLFLVGDPMQSIYLFRNSEVGLFLRTRREGVGDMRLDALQLSRNFRSVPVLVDWANGAFSKVFPTLEDVRGSAVTFLPAQAARGEESGDADAVLVLPQVTSEPQPEAEWIAAEISRLRTQHPAWRIAVLVETRTRTPPVLTALRRAGVPVHGVELASLAERPVVRDLIAVGQALLDDSDRTAWLALLHSPGCGFTLRELQLLVESAADSPLLEALAEYEDSAKLPAATARRLARVTPVLRAAWQARGRTDLATAVESLWRRLGGWHACRNPAERSAALQYLAALRRANESEGVLDRKQLQALAQKLRDAGAPEGENPVEILTIHRAKGLEWDAVFVPALGRTPRADQPPLLRWLELPAPGVDTDLLLAVRSLGEDNASDALSAYIKKLQRERQENERVRLMYVAVTRARQRLYLSGHAPWNEKLQRPEPDGRSLLKVLWPAVQQEFAAASPAQAADANADSGRQNLETPWHPLAADFVVPQGRESLRVASLSGGEREAPTGPEYDWVGPAARAAGTLVHGELERFAISGLPTPDALAQRLTYFGSRLQELGMDSRAARRLAETLLERLQRLVQDPRAHWLLNEPHSQARSEWRLSGIVDGQLRNAVIDRSFVAEGCRWVVDFKTSTHAGAGLEQFLESELQRYRPQLMLYRALVSRLGPEPVRTALYFPWLREFRELN